MQVLNMLLPALELYMPVVIVIAAIVAVLVSFYFAFGPGQRWQARVDYAGRFFGRLLARGPARTWIVDQAEDLAGLGQRLNYLDEHGFKPYQVLPGQDPLFLIIAVRSGR